MTVNANAGHRSMFEFLESRLMLTGAFASAAQNAIIYDTRGNLDVAYYDVAAKDLKFVQQSVSGAWSAPTVVDGASPDVGKSLAIALDGKGNPAIAYQDSANSDLKYADFDGAAWKTTVVDARKTTGFNPSLTFDASGEALITYYKQNAHDLLLATLRSNGTWAIVTVASKGNVGQFSSVAINPSTGKPAVAFTDASGKIKYVTATAKSSFGNPVTVAKFSHGAWVSLAFSGATPHVGYVDAGTGHVDLVTGSGKTFTTQFVGSVRPKTAAGAQVLIDPTTDLPSVVYHDTTSVFVAKPAAGTFSSTLVSSAGENSAAAVQPGSGSIVYSVVNPSGGTLSISTTAAPPAAPANLAAVAVSASAVDLTWTSASSTAAGFLVERSTDGVNFTTVATTAASVTSLSDAALAEGTNYFYRVIAIGALNTSAPSAVASATTLPAAPAAFTAADINPTSIQLSWTNPSSAATGFVLRQSADGGSTWTTIASPAASAMQYTDSSVTEGGSYIYQIYATSAASNSVTVTSATVVTQPAAPSDLTASVDNSTTVALNWTNHSIHATGYVIQRSTDSANFTTVGTVDGSAATYTDTGAAAATQYWYRVYATNSSSGLTSDFSNVAATTTTSAPQNLSATAASATSVNLNWTAGSGAATYTILRSTSGGAFVALPSTTTDTHFSDSTAVEGTSYTYEVSATDGNSSADVSAPVTVVTPPSAPTSLAVAALSDSAITLTWTNTSASNPGFTILRAPPGGTAAPIGYAAAGSATYTDTAVTEGTQYVYEVVATGSGGGSAPATVNAATTPAAPQSLALTVHSANSIGIGWSDVSTVATQYVVRQSTDGGSTFATIATLGPTAEQFTDSTVTEGGGYTYEVRAQETIGGATLVSPWVISSAVSTPPIAPASVSAVAASSTQVDVSWENASSIQTGFAVYRDDGSGFSLIGTALAGDTIYHDTAALPGTSYTYQVRATGSTGESLVNPLSTVTTPPPTPILTSATPVSASEVDLVFSEDVGATDLVVLRKAPGDVTWMIDSGPLAPDATNFADTTVSAATQYTYAIEAFAGDTASVPSAAQTALTEPAPVTTITLSTVTSSTISFTWNPVSGADNYNILRATGAGSFSSAGSVSGSTTGFTDDNMSAGLAAGTAYTYEVVPVNATGGVAPTTFLAATTLAAAPSGLSATPVSGTQVNLAWTNNDSTGAQIGIERSDGGGSFILKATLDSSAIAWNDTGLTPGETYAYRVSTINTGGTHYMSDVAFVAATTFPAAPTLTAQSQSDGTINLAWSAPNTAASYHVQEQANGAGGWTDLATTTAANSAVATGLTTNTSYAFRVQATNGSGTGDYSAIASALTVPTVPSAVTPTAVSSTEIDLAWTGDAGVTFTVYRSPAGQNTPTLIATVVGVNTFNDQNVVAGQAYDYQIYASNAGGTTATAGTVAGAVPLPTPVGNLQAAAASSTEVDLTWTASTGADTYSVNRFDGTWQLLASSLSSSTLGFNDTSAVPNQSYTYQVVAVNSGGSQGAVVNIMTIT